METNRPIFNHIIIIYYILHLNTGSTTLMIRLLILRQNFNLITNLVYFRLQQLMLLQPQVWLMFSLSKQGDWLISLTQPSHDLETSPKITCCRLLMQIHIEIPEKDARNCHSNHRGFYWPSGRHQPTSSVGGPLTTTNNEILAHIMITKILG